MMRISLFIVTLLTVVAAQAANPRIAWDANPEPDIGGYKLYCRSPSLGLRVFSVGKVTEFALTQQHCPVGETTTLSLTAFNTAGLESAESVSLPYFSDPANPPPAVPFGKVPNPPKTPIATRNE